jgi:hypothetical protein
MSLVPETGDFELVLKLEVQKESSIVLSFSQQASVAFQDVLHPNVKCKIGRLCRHDFHRPPTRSSKGAVKDLNGTSTDF